MKIAKLLAGIATATALTLSQGVFAQKSMLNDVLDNGVLKVGTTGDFNPMSFKDPATGEYDGHQIDAAKQLAKEHGIFVGISAGANILAAEKWIEDNDPTGIVVTFLCDIVDRYFSCI